MRAKFLIVFTLIISALITSGQNVIDTYIKEGLLSNQNIYRQELGLEKSLFALKEAKSLYYPKVSFLADYFLADGGRTVDFPAGDLLNSVYSSLNQLTNSNRFPQLQNEKILLNPNNFYDARLRATVPLYNKELSFNKKTKQEQIQLQTFELNLLKRELVKEIKVAYFAYLQSVQAIKIYENALSLVLESKRVNESLFKNDRVNKTAVVRAQNEVVKYETLKSTAIIQSNSARSYFNFLLNKDLDHVIQIDSNYQLQIASISLDTTLQLREELQKLSIAEVISRDLTGLAKSWQMPKVNTFVDLGSQGFDGKFDNNSRYYFIGLSLQWDLFNSRKSQYAIQQASINEKIQKSESEYAYNQIRLQYNTATNNYRNAIENYKASVVNQKTARIYYSDILKLYKEGQALFIELLDAQNQLIQNDLQVNISLYETYIKAALVERANASYQF
ncbi:MAG: TolC family protein [Chitinophagaceae bacterium]|jgi:outer membrane protein TolC|nr:TolC family protein [Chitinophagaceae bacterium]